MVPDTMLDKTAMGEKDFEILFHQWFDDLARFVCSYVRDGEVTRDIVHDVFLTIWQHREHLDISRSMKSYLFTLARNYALNYIRHRRVEQVHEESLVYDWQNWQEELEEEGAEVERLRKKLEELPEKQREVLEKFFVGGKMYQEIAAELGISLNTVKTHLKRAMKTLRDELQGDVVLLFVLFDRCAGGACRMG